jgi:Arc/MetJ-type ribon-helix-helix transcriptional regulator
MKPRSHTDLAIPAALVAEIQTAADDEHRPATEVVRDALEGYLENRRWRLRELASQRTRELGLPDDELPLTAEHRATMREKIAQGVRSLRDGKGADGDAFFAKIEAQFEVLERQGDK